MNIVKRNPNGNGFPLVDEFFKDIMGGTQYVNKTIPPVNIRETEHAFTLQLMVPGYSKGDFNVVVDNDLLIISSQLNSEKEEKEEGKFTRKEFSLAAFKRSFTLPETVNEENINASYQDGILTITLPKKEEALPKAKRLVAIS